MKETPDYKKYVGFYPKQEQAPRRAKKAWRKFLPILLVCLACFSYGSIRLFLYYKDSADNQKASEKIVSLYSPSAEQTTPKASPSATPIPTEALSSNPSESLSSEASTTENSIWPKEYPDNRYLRVSSDFYSMKAQNPDIVAYLKIDDLMEEAVVLRDNLYYLTHDLNRQKSAFGALFLDEKTDLSSPPMQYIIHGHNMKDGSKFGFLQKYKKDIRFYYAHPYITFNTQYEKGEYVIFAVSEISVNAEDSDFVPFSSFTSFEDEEEFSAYVSTIEKYSCYHTEMDVIPGDRLLCLSTCISEDSDKRLLVLARKIRANEDTLEMNVKVMSAY